ncbi:hypothetical protein B0J13DRAFT_35417 [Dactylonectria estremocensis]|uniref:Meiotically up-regulated protein Msb1/Mug8 domain-containing protein n=1 Tax=Dactylonectria estremocensis TaxID=1079267 RepID=A0A9P9JED9_9HYPO|nr:hypothetical protein B0J13DRAFT_35417 [Dactylonectria estremocensis]
MPASRLSQGDTTLVPNAPLKPSPSFKPIPEVTPPESSGLAQQNVSQAPLQGIWKPIHRKVTPEKKKPFLKVHHALVNEKTTVEPAEVHELIRACTAELKSRSLEIAFLLHPFPASSRVLAPKAFNFLSFYLSNRPSAEDLPPKLRVMEVPVISTILRWCWARIPGGLVGWEAYDLFKVGKKEYNLSWDAFSAILPFSRGKRAQERIVFDFFDLIATMAGPELNNPKAQKLSQMAAWWAFETEGHDRFDDGYRSWSQAANATNHLFFTYLRNHHGPEQDPKKSVPLLRMLGEKDYPPAMPFLLQTRACKVVLEVREFAKTPMKLLFRAGRTLGMPKPLRDMLDYADGEPTRGLTSECLRVLNAIDENILHGNHWDSRNQPELFRAEKRKSDRIPSLASVLSPARVADVTWIDMGECFWWSWMQAHASEETKKRSLAFGRSVVVETSDHGGLYVVFEEIKEVEETKDVKDIEEASGVGDSRRVRRVKGTWDVNNPGNPWGR